MTETLHPDYFDKIYEAADDPWNFSESSYEAAKYARTLDALPHEFYRNAFEIGCSIGVLTEKLARRCKKLLAVDVARKALAAAENRCANLPQVTFEIMSVPQEFPDEVFDLILISEVGYYLSPADWQKTVTKVCAHTESGGNIVLVHWRPFVGDYPQTGDAVHDSFAEFAAGKVKLLQSLTEEKYRLDVWEKL